MPHAMSKNPLVSVIIPVYNRARLVKRAVKSVLDQTCQDFEVLVVDDCSTDDTAEVVGALDDSRVRVVRNSTNAGVAFSRNRGIGLARGRFISLLDSDDYYQPAFLERSVARMQESDQRVGFIWTGIRVVDDDGKEMYTSTWKPPVDGDPYRQFLRSLKIGTGCGLTFKAEALRQVRFDPALRAAEDTEFFLRLARQYRFDYIDEPLIVITKHRGERVTRDVRNTFRTYLSIFRTHRDAICREADVRIKFFEKIMTLAYRCGRRRVGRRFFRALLPGAALNPRLVAKFVYFEMGGQR